MRKEDLNRVIQTLEHERDVARNAAEEVLESLLAHKAELQGLLVVMWLLVERFGEIRFTEAEVSAIPKGARIRQGQDKDTGEFIIAHYTQEATPETPIDGQADGSSGGAGTDDAAALEGGDATG